jgi:hypothetical protein
MTYHFQKAGRAFRQKREIAVHEAQPSEVGKN